MMNAIDEIKRQYVYTVQPVRLFEDENPKAPPSNTFEFISKINSNQSKFNPFHPNVADGKTANQLDLLS